MNFCQSQDSSCKGLQIKNIVKSELFFCKIIAIFSEMVYNEYVMRPMAEKITEVYLNAGICKGNAE